MGKTHIQWKTASRICLLRLAMGTPLFQLMDFAFYRWMASVLTVQSTRRWNSGKPHGQNAHGVENCKQNLSPTTRHVNAPVSTQVQFQLRDFTLYRSMTKVFTHEWKMLAHENGAVRNDKKTNWFCCESNRRTWKCQTVKVFIGKAFPFHILRAFWVHVEISFKVFIDKEISAVAPHRFQLCKIQYWPTPITLLRSTLPQWNCTTKRT